MGVDKNTAILVVNHNCKEMEGLTDYLTGKGHQVYSVNQDHNVLEIIKKQKFDAVVYGAGDQNAAELGLVFKLINSENFKTPILMLVSSGLNIELAKAYNMGVEGVFRGKVDFENFESVLEKCLSPFEEKWLRKAERYEVSLHLELRVGSSDKAIKTNIVNIARGGMFIALEENLPAIDDVIEFNLVYEDRPWGDISGTCITRWRRTESLDNTPSGIGVEFLDLSWQSVTNLLEILNAIKTNSFIPSGE